MRPLFVGFCQIASSERGSLTVTQILCARANSASWHFPQSFHQINMKGLAIFALVALMCMATASPVVQVTDKDFQEKVVKPAHDKDVIILFYDLKRAVFAPLFEGVAKKFPSSSVIFAQYDCHKHDPPAPFADIHHDKVHYPAVYFYRQGAKPEHYQGPRMQVSLIDWIKNHPHIKHAEL